MVLDSQAGKICRYMHILDIGCMVHQIEEKNKRNLTVKLLCFLGQYWWRYEFLKIVVGQTTGVQVLIILWLQVRYIQHNISK